MAQGAVTPRHFQIWQDLAGSGWRLFALSAALELDLFSQISAGHHSAEQIASAIGANSDATRRLLDAIAAMGYVKKARGSYRLAPIAAQFLVRGMPLYMGQMAQLGRGFTVQWQSLAEVVRSGKPLQAGDPEMRGEFFAALVPTIFPSSFIAAEAAVKKLKPAVRRKIGRILDIGAGSAAWSIPFARAIKAARVTVVDLPVVTRVTRQFTERWGVADRYDYLEGDFRELNFGTARFDLAILGHILHGEGPKWGRRLLKRTCDALVPGGLLLIAEFVPNDERTGSAEALLFGLNMLIGTPEGDVFTMREYREWLKEAGFRKVATIPAPHYSPLILATK